MAGATHRPVVPWIPRCRVALCCDPPLAVLCLQDLQLVVRRRRAVEHRQVVGTYQSVLQEALLKDLPVVLWSQGLVTHLLELVELFALVLAELWSVGVVSQEDL